jgi:Predicted signal transduction protein with a C-terminal ATPase domain
LMSIILAFLYSQINLLATGLVWLTSLVLVFVYLRKINKAVLFSSFAILIYIFASYVTGMLLGSLPILLGSEIGFILSSIIYILIAFCTKKISIFMSKKVYISELLIWVAASLSTITFASYFIIIVIERFSGEHSSMGRANAFFIISYGMLSTMIFLVLLYSVQKYYIAKERQKEMHYLKEYTEQLEKNYTEMRRFKHDYQNILLSLEEYIKEKDLVRLEKYFYTKIKEASINIERNDFKLSQLSNLRISELKSLLANKLSVSQELGIDTEIEVMEKIESIAVDSILLVRSLGIMLDNAIEAAEPLDNGMIRVAVFKRLDKVVIVIVNSCSPDVPKLFELKKEGFSTKGAGRGIGLGNLERLVANKDNVTLDTKIEKGLFTQILSIGE